MHQADLHKILSQIPPVKWEENLAIGTFVQIKNINFTKRPYSYISKCLIVGSEAEKSVYVKIYRNHNNITPSELRSKINNDYENTLYWYELFRHSPHFHSVKAVLCMPELNLLVTEDIPGESLGVLISKNARLFSGKRKADELLKHAYGVGKLLKYRNDILISNEPKLSMDDFLEYLKIRLNILTKDTRRGFPIYLKKEILEFIEKNKRYIFDKDLLTVTSHGDFNPGNIIINKNGITVIDIGENRNESYLLDVSKLYSRILLYSYKPYFNKKIIRKLQKTILEGFQFCENPVLFDFFKIRNILTHLTNITRFYKYSAKENIYNYWVSKNEILLIKNILKKAG